MTTCFAHRPSGDLCEALRRKTWFSAHSRRAGRKSEAALQGMLHCLAGNRNKRRPCRSGPSCRFYPEATPQEPGWFPEDASGLERHVGLSVESRKKKRGRPVGGSFSGNALPLRCVGRAFLHGRLPSVAKCTENVNPQRRPSGPPMPPALEDRLPSLRLCRIQIPWPCLQESDLSVHE